MNIWCNDPLAYVVSNDKSIFIPYFSVNNILYHRLLLRFICTENLVINLTMYEKIMDINQVEFLPGMQGKFSFPKFICRPEWKETGLFSVVNNWKIGCMYAKSFQLCPTLCDLMDHSPPCSCVHGTLQARILEWLAMPSSSGYSWSDWTQLSFVSCLGKQVLYR